MMKQFLLVHLTYYLYFTTKYMRHLELDIKDFRQWGMIVNMIMIGIYLIIAKGKHFVIFTLQLFIIFLFYKVRPTQIQLSALLSLLGNQNHIFCMINVIIAFIFGNPFDRHQEIIFVLLMFMLIASLIQQKQTDLNMNEKHNQMVTGDRFMQDLPFPLFIVNVKSQIYWQNQKAQVIISDCGVDTKDGIKMLFQEPDMFLNCLNQELDQVVVQLNTILLKQHIKQQQQQPSSNLSSQSQLLSNSQRGQYIMEQMNKTIHRTSSNANFLTLRSLSINEVVQREVLYILQKKILSLFIKPIFLNQMRLFLVCVNTNKSFQQNNMLQNLLIQQIKQNATQMLYNLQQDYIKWDNMRNLEIIKESDLKLLSSSIVDLYRIIFKFEAYEVSSRFFPQQSNQNFQFKNLIIYLIEIFAGRYLNQFDHITLYFDNSIQDMMKGDSASFSLIFISLLEIIAKFSKKTTILKIYCNLDQVTQQNTAYQIQIQLLWHLDEKLDYIFKSFFSHQFIPNDIDIQIRRYLQVIQKIQNDTKINYKEQTQPQKMSDILSELQITTQFLISDQNNEDFHNMFQVPQLSLTFCRVANTQNPNDVKWQQKEQPKIAGKDKGFNQPTKQTFVVPKIVAKKEIIINAELDRARRSSIITPTTLNIHQKKLLFRLIKNSLKQASSMLSDRITSILKSKLIKLQSDFVGLSLIETDGSSKEEVENNYSSSGKDEIDSFCSDQNIDSSEKSLNSSYQNDLPELVKSIENPQSMIFQPNQNNKVFSFINQQLNRKSAEYQFDGERVQTLSDNYHTEQDLENTSLEQQLAQQKKEKYDQQISNIKAEVGEIADFNQIPLNQEQIKEIMEILPNNVKLNTLKLIKCDLTDEIIISLIESILTTKITTIYLQYNKIQGELLKHLLLIFKKEKKYALQTLFLKDNPLQESFHEQEIHKLSQLGLRIIV